MALNKLYYVYGLDTACFYTDEENEIETQLIEKRHTLFELKETCPKEQYNKDGSINKALLFLISDKIHLKLKQENLYKKNHLWKITNYELNGYDIYIFKNNLIIEEWMVIYAEEVEPCHKLLPDWIHTRKFYDYKNKLIKIYSYDQFNNRIYDYDRVEKMF